MPIFKVGDKVRRIVGTYHGMMTDNEDVITEVTASCLGLKKYGAGHDPTSFVLANKTMHDLEAGDILIDENGNEREVFGVAGKIIFYSDETNDGLYHYYAAHVQRLIDRGWELKGSEPEIKEVTMDEVAKQMGVPVEQLRIKKED